MLKTWFEISLIGVVLFGIIFSNISADSNDNETTIDIKKPSYYINVAVFVDNSTIEFYKQNLTRHVVSQMNKTSKTFRHLPIGHPIRIFLTEITIVTEKFVTTNNSNVNETLNKFCKWQNQQRISDDNGFDVAIFLTRINMCEKDDDDDDNTSKCKGYVSEGAICYQKNACAVVVDDGDSTTSRINHVIGDFLNMDEESKIHLNDGLTNRSRNIIDSFFATDKGNCLLHDRPNVFYLSETLLFHDVYSNKQLCKVIHNTKYLSQTTTNKCESLVKCSGKKKIHSTLEKQIFLTRQDGIECDIDSYCYRGKCNKINWSLWEQFEECDKICGGGKTKLIRQHNDTRFNSDIGETFHYVTCNNHKCPNTFDNFMPITRDQQCSRFNDDKHNWTSFIFNREPCQLYCSANNKLDHFGAVIDGTSCDNKIFHVCINEICKHSLFTNYYDRNNFTVNLNDTSITRKQSSTSESLIFTELYSLPYYIKIVVFVDPSMVDYHKENLTIHIKMLMAKASNVFKHPSIGLPIEIVLTDIRIMEGYLPTVIWQKKLQYDSLIMDFIDWTDREPDSTKNYDIAMLLTRIYGWDSRGITSPFSDKYIASSHIVVHDNGVRTIPVIIHEIGHALGARHDFEEDICKQNILFSKAHHVMAIGGRAPLIWSICSQMSIAHLLSKKSYLLNKPKVFIDVSHEPSLGKFYSLDKQCEMIDGPGFIFDDRTLNSSINQCKKIICWSSNKTSNLHSDNPMLDFTPCGDGKMCYEGDCIEETQLKLIHGNWSEWIPVGNCSRSCGIGIRKAIRKCNNPQPEYGGDYCVGQKVRFETCSVMPCPEMAVDFRQQQCSKFNNETRNLTAFYDPKDTKKLCTLTCQVNGNSSSLISFGNVIDGTSCRNGSHDIDHICNNGGCKKIGCHKNDNFFDVNSIFDICNISRDFYNNPEGLIAKTSNYSLSDLLYEPPENWTVNNSCIIMYRMKKNWEMIMDYWDEEKSLLFNTSIKYYEKSSIISHLENIEYDINVNTSFASNELGETGKLTNKLVKNCQAIKQKIQNISDLYSTEFKKCIAKRLSTATIKNKIFSKNLNTSYFDKIRDFDNSCKNATNVNAQSIVDEKPLMINNLIKLKDSVHIFKKVIIDDLNFNVKSELNCRGEAKKKFMESMKNLEGECPSMNASLLPLQSNYH